MNDPHHDHSSYFLSTEHMPARFTCILSPDPHNNLLRWAILLFFTLIDEETQTVTCPGSQREEPAINSEPSDLSFGFSPCCTDVTRAAPQKNSAITSPGLLQWFPHHNHPLATSKPFSTLKPEQHFQIANLITLLCSKSLQWIAIGQAHISGFLPVKVIDFCNNFSERIPMSSLEKYIMNSGEMFYL